MRHSPHWVSPFGNLRIKGCLSPPRSLSQTTTSFIGIFCQAILRMLLLDALQPLLHWIVVVIIVVLCWLIFNCKVQLTYLSDSPYVFHHKWWESATGRPLESECRLFENAALIPSKVKNRFERSLNATKIYESKDRLICSFFVNCHMAIFSLCSYLPPSLHWRVSWDKEVRTYSCKSGEV